MKILYLSHVSWNWTKQRPQFLAEALSKYFDITYVYKRPYKIEQLKNENILTVKQLARLPLSRFRLIRKVNNFFYRLQLLTLCKHSDIIWFTSPDMYDCISTRFFKKKVIVYDCMDDMIELCPFDKQMGAKEKEMFTNSNIVFSSSSYLADKLLARYGNKQIIVVNNAISVNFEDVGCELPLEFKKFFIENKKTLTYIGSVSSWMDFELLRAIHFYYPDITINIWGPHHFKAPIINGINYCGVVDHKYIYGILSLSDILIMPFVVNELIKSVNPVKLYEYIYSGKPIMAPKYGESLQFCSFVNLYEDQEEAITIIGKMIKGEILQKPLEECRCFVDDNTWDSRVRVIRNAIASYVKERTMKA